MSEIDEALNLFPTWCIQRELGMAWDDTAQALWARALTELAAQRAAGAPLRDLVTRLRGPQAAVLDEAEELDQVVRWWEQARRHDAALPSDFGALWQAYETLALELQLVALGQACRERHERGEAAAAVPELATRAAKVALRYAALKPLLRWLTPLAGTQMGSGFTF
jgi:aminoglycoside/choline kinase family phosphotransferase